MTDRNWEAELAKIDKQLASVSDEKLLASSAPPAMPAGIQRLPVMDARMANNPGGGGARAIIPPPSAAVAAAVAAASAGGTWRGWVKVTIAVAAAAGLMYWPWPAKCGMPLLGFTAATGGVALLGLWSAVGSWRHRLGVAHVASLLVIVWGMLLGAREVLPRVGYAIPTAARSVGWSCDAVPAALPTTTPPAPAVTIPGTAPSGAATPRTESASPGAPTARTTSGGRVSM